MLKIGRVFSISFLMFRQRFWRLLGMWLVFLVIQLGTSAAMFVILLGLGTAGAAGIGAGLDDPMAMAGLGAGMIVTMILFYTGYIVILLAQQAAMVAIASPLEEPNFGGAMVRGFKSALPFLVLAILAVIGLLAVSVIVSAISAGAEAAGAIGPLAMTIVSVYLACRLAVLIPVVAVDGVLNPFAALARSWSATRGKVMAILVAMLIFVAGSLVVLGIPAAILGSAALVGQGNPESAGGMAALGFAIMIPLLIAYMMYASAFIAALHSEATGGRADRLEDVFA
ncbi:hypothetical protein [Erythrobacter sp. R86502]|uniref:hypothetical protein n=1 Tax=Erythrobacter sp. R86502 TaxID=3093846 RepID=UPI0036D2854C